MTFEREKIKPVLGDFAQRGAFIGTSSWKYSGWQGQLYNQGRYVWRGRYAESRFERLCLQEYAEVFKTVCVDAAYYKFPDLRFLEPLFSQVPSDFQFGFKVTDEITVKNFPNLPRFGLRAGTANEHFLNAELFEAAFLGPCQPFRQNIGLLIFEFSRFSKADFAQGRDFVERLDTFLARLPKGWPYGVEIRNRSFLQPEYFEMLKRRGVAHIFNSWQNMPSLEEQIALRGNPGQPEFSGARLLLRPGRKYEEAVRLFSPYNRIQDPYPEGRAAGAALLRQALASNGMRKAFIFVNNRFEGNALETIAGILGQSMASVGA
jgi:uncharacterized protein YecE (DUF72 family)